MGFLQLLNQSAEVHSKLVGTKRKWEIPLIKATPVFPFDLPKEDSIKKAWEQFTKPDEEAEVAEATDGNSGRER